MKSLVAFFLVLATFISGAVGQRRTSPRANSTAQQPNETIRICQGVPIPDGYVIIAYTTSSACPHGAYLLKKQASYDGSAGVTSASRRPAAGETSNATDNESKPAREGKSEVSRTNSAETSSAVNQRAARSSGPVSPSAGANNNGNVAANATRPRRVTSEQPEAAEAPQQAPPALIGSEVASARRPPILGNGDTTPNSGAANDTANAVAQPTPEEVDENDIVRVDTTLVTVPVSVLDHDGRFVPGLKREDFTVFENN